MNKILILGAGLPQVPLIKKAKELGLYVIVSSIKGNYPGFEFADKVYFEDTTDEKEILRIAKKETVSGIVTAGTDVAVKTIGYVCDHLNLPGITLDKACLVTDKALMKVALSEGHVSTAPFKCIESLEAAYAACKTLGFPVMFKCVDKSGSRGIVKVDSESQIEESFNYAFSFTKKKYIVIEKFIEGIELGVDGYIGGNIEFFAPYQRGIYNNGYTDIPFRHIFPIGNFPNVKNSKVIEEAKRAVTALGLDGSFFDMDIIVTQEGEVFILEVGARIGGVFIPETIGKYYNMDIHEKIILNSLGKPICFPSIGKGVCLSELIIAEKDGIVKEIEIDSDLINQLGEVYLGCKTGMTVRKFRNGADAIGGIITKGGNLDDAENKLAQMKEAIRIVIE